MDKYSKFDEFVKRREEEHTVDAESNHVTPYEPGICETVHKTQIELQNLWGQIVEIVRTIDNTRIYPEQEAYEPCCLSAAASYNLSLVEKIAWEVDFILGKL